MPPVTGLPGTCSGPLCALRAIARPLTIIPPDQNPNVSAIYELIFLLGNSSEVSKKVSSIPIPRLVRGSDNFYFRRGGSAAHQRFWGAFQGTFLSVPLAVRLYSFDSVCFVQPNESVVENEGKVKAK